MNEQYTDSKLYDQILSFDTLLDIEKARAVVAGTTRFGSFHSLYFIPRR